MFGVMCKVGSYGIFSDCMSRKTLFASCDHLILARGQIIRAERRFRFPLFSAEKFDVIKLNRLVNQAATGSLREPIQEPYRTFSGSCSWNP
jgi:hypothetical protein